MNTKRYEGQGESTRLVQGSPDGRPDNHADAEKGLEDGKHRGHVFWEFLGDHAKGARQKTAISTCLNYPESPNMCCEVRQFVRLNALT